MPKSNASAKKTFITESTNVLVSGNIAGIKFKELNFRSPTECLQYFLKQLGKSSEIRSTALTKAIGLVHAAVTAIHESHGGINRTDAKGKSIELADLEVIKTVGLAFSLEDDESDEEIGAVIAGGTVGGMTVEKMVEHNAREKVETNVKSGDASDGATSKNDALTAMEEMITTTTGDDDDREEEKQEDAKSTVSGNTDYTEDWDLESATTSEKASPLRMVARAERMKAKKAARKKKKEEKMKKKLDELNRATVKAAAVGGEVTLARSQEQQLLYKELMEVVKEYDNTVDKNKDAINKVNMFMLMNRAAIAENSQSMYGSKILQSMAMGQITLPIVDEEMVPISNGAEYDGNVVSKASDNCKNVLSALDKQFGFKWMVSVFGKVAEEAFVDSSVTGMISALRYIHERTDLQDVEAQPGCSNRYLDTKNPINMSTGKPKSLLVFYRGMVERLDSFKEGMRNNLSLDEEGMKTHDGINFLNNIEEAEIQALVLRSTRDSAVYVSICAEYLKRQKVTMGKKDSSQIATTACPLSRVDMIDICKNYVLPATGTEAIAHLNRLKQQIKEDESQLEVNFGNHGAPKQMNSGFTADCHYTSTDFHDSLQDFLNYCVTKKKPFHVQGQKGTPKGLVDELVKLGHDKHNVVNTLASLCRVVYRGLARKHGVSQSVGRKKFLNSRAVKNSVFHTVLINYVASVETPEEKANDADSDSSDDSTSE